MDDLLPKDVLASCILRRLNPRSLAACRCVCKAWRAVVDTHSLLRADLLPLSVYGIFLVEDLSVRFFARPLMDHKIADEFDYVDLDDVPRRIPDHRNGLLLLDEWVVNPATRQCAPLPPPPPADFHDRRYLVFDPTVSPHYHVFSIPVVSLRFGLLTQLIGDTEWPPSPYTLNVFSSATERWEKRSFLRQGEATGTTIADINFSGKHRYAAYWRDALYVHSEGDFIIRIALSSHKYKVIPSPTGREVAPHESLYLGKSTNGVYCALICNEEERLRIWLLDDQTDQWVLKNDVTIQPLLRILPQDFGHHNYGYWTLLISGKYAYEPMAEKRFEWDMNSGVTFESQAKAKEKADYCDIRILGFHPYQEILFLWTLTSKTVVAYHLNTSKAQDVGKLPVPFVKTSFVYTPLLDEGIIRKQFT